MRIFGPLMLLSLFVTLLLLIPHWHSLAFWLVGTALLVLMVDTRIAMAEHIPVN